jgi:hypothetical protein
MGFSFNRAILRGIAVLVKENKEFFPKLKNYIILEYTWTLNGKTGTLDLL